MILTQSGRDFYNATKDNYSHIISIVCPDEKELTKHAHDNHLILKMWDVDRVLVNQFRKYEPPGEGECILAIQWAERRWENCLREHKPFNLLIHCDAGVSRSSAISLGVLWNISSHIFKQDPSDLYLRAIIDARKDWCYDKVDDINSTGLRRYIQGRFNPGVRPNQAILRFYRKYFNDFPW